jgi:hypothetical protein
VYGAWCEEEVEGQTVPLEGIGADLTLPLTPSLTLLTEVSRGSNLKIFLGRSAYYKDAAGAYRDQESTAGWLELYYAGKALDLYAGYSAELFDDPVPAGTLGDSDALFAGIIHKLGKGVSYGLELTRFTGDYEGMDKAAAHQVTASVTYTF